MKINWYKRRKRAEESEIAWTDVASIAFRNGDWKNAVRFARLADAAAKRRMEAEKKLGAEMQAYQKKLLKKRKPVEEADYVDVEDSYVEWEFAFEYEAAESDSSNVDINFRVWRSDSKPFTESEARRAMDYVRTHRGDAPRGYKVTGIDWRNPPKPFRSNSDRGLSVEEVQDNIVSILDAVADSPGLWRLGAVKE